MWGMSEATVITHEPGALRFVDKSGSVLEYRLGGDGSLIVTHVEVPEALRGQGLAPRLMEAALGYADAAGLAVAAECSYAALYLKRHRR